VPKAKRDIEAGLTRKGFKRREGDHSYFVYESLDGKKTMASTKVSHGRGFDVADNLLSLMAKQCGINKAQFLKLVECPLQRDDYEVLLRAAGKL
jgi:hypothetical protein